MSTPPPAPDPTAATDVPASRAKLPPLPQQGRDWFRRGREAEPSELELVPSEPPAPVRQALAEAEVVETLEDGPTEDGEPVPAQEVWKWTDPYLELAPAARQLAYLAHMCELLERQERRYQQQDPRDPVLGEALEQTQQYYNGRRDKLFHLGRTLTEKVAEKGGINTRYLAALGSAVGGALVTGALVLEFVLDHLDVLAALVRGL